MATPEEIQRLIKDLDKVYRDLGKVNPFASMNLNALGDATQQAQQLRTSLNSARQELADINADLSEVVVGFKKTLDEIKNTNNGLNLATKTFSGLSDIAKKLRYDQAGISELSIKELGNLEKQAKQKREDLNISKDLLTSRIAELKELERKGQLDRKGTEELSKSLMAAAAVKNELRDQDTLSQSINKRVEYRNRQEEEINKKLGAAPQIIGGIGKALAKLGLPDFGLDEALKDTMSILRAEKDRVSVGQALSTFTGQVGSKIKDQLTAANFLQLAITEFYKALVGADKATGELAKSFGTSYGEASNLRNELNTIANLSADVNINTAALQKSLVAINNEFGTATMLNKELLKDYTQITTVAGYTEEAALGLARTTAATGTDLSDNTSAILGQASALNAVNGLALNEKQIVEGVAKASAATTLSLGMQPKELAKAVFEAKALGVSLEQVEQISSSLLDFENSISAELEAELLTGKNLNLEKARLAALNGDIATVAEEIAKQTGTAADFTNMNVIQQEALAKSVGMTREDLAKSLIEREALAKIGKDDKTALEAYNRLKKEGLSDDEIAKKLGDDKLAAQLKSQSVQERFNASIEKLRDLFIGLADPVLSIVSPFVDILLPVLSGIQYIIGGIGTALGWVGEKIGKILPNLGILGNILKYVAKIGVIFAAYQAFSSLAAIPFVGYALGAVAAAATTAAGFGLINGISKGDDVVSPGYGKRTLLAPEGAIALNDKDTVIAGTDLGKGKSTPPSTDMSPLIGEIRALRTTLEKISTQSGIINVDGSKVAEVLWPNMERLSNTKRVKTQ
jgi:hypothetical protein